MAPSPAGGGACRLLEHLRRHFILEMSISDGGEHRDRPWLHQLVLLYNNISIANMEVLTMNLMGWNSQSNQASWPFCSFFWFANCRMEMFGALECVDLISERLQPSYFVYPSLHMVQVRKVSVGFFLFIRSFWKLSLVSSVINF